MTGSPPFATLFSELRRRHVLRVGAVYLVAAWLVIQVSDLVVPRLGLPDALVTGIILVIGIGFPIVLVLAWALELTPDGRIVRTPSSEVPSQLSSTMLQISVPPGRIVLLPSLQSELPAPAGLRLV